MGRVSLRDVHNLTVAWRVRLGAKYEVWERGACLSERATCAVQVCVKALSNATAEAHNVQNCNPCYVFLDIDDVFCTLRFRGSLTT
jgi:hypothetical protein